MAPTIEGQLTYEGHHDEKFTPHNVTETTSDEDPKELAGKIMVLVLTGKSVNFFTAVFVNTCSTFYTQPVTI